MIQARLTRAAEASRIMIRSRPATSSVTAVQAHPSRFNAHVRRRRIEPRIAGQSLRTHKVPEVTSRFRSSKRPGTWQPTHERLALLRYSIATSSATSSSVRASGQKDAPIDEHNTDRICPKAGASTCSSPSVGVRRRLPWGSLPFDGISDGDRCAPDYLPGTFRSQGFSPSQRFDPTDALWLCFTPHPSLGFQPPEPLPHSQPSHLSARVALLPLLREQHTDRDRRSCPWRLQSLAPTAHSTLAPTRLAL